MKGVGMLVVQLKGVNFGFWSHLGCSVQNAIIFSSEGLVQRCTPKNIKYIIYCLCFNMVSFRGQKKSLNHAQISLLQGFNSNFPTSIPTPVFICGLRPREDPPMLTLTNKKQLGVLSSSFKANGCFLWALDTLKFGVCRVNHKSLLLKAPGGGGDSAYERGGDARRKF